MAKTDFLVELGTEELPPKALNTLISAFADSIKSQTMEAGLGFESLEKFSTPRRMAIRLNGLDSRQQDQIIERKGPSCKAAFDAQGKPTKALTGFLCACNAKEKDLTTFKSDKGEWVMVTLQQKGKSACEVLPGIISHALTQLPIPKLMRWGSNQDEFVRPVHWLLMLLGSQVVPAMIFNQKAGNTTYGHRFLAPKPITITSAKSYETQLKKQGFVMANQADRQAEICKVINALASKHQVSAITPEVLLTEVCNLVEWPVALFCQFEKAFLKVPQEALISAMQQHQKCFALQDQKGKLTAHFITISNIKSKAPDEVIHGNERVMRARLSDAAFFYHTDCKTPLSKRAVQLEKVIFQKRLGTLADKTKRLEKLTPFIAKALGSSSEHAKRAAHLAKVDLLSDMVMEFPELQGIMGQYYAKHDGENPAVCQALKEQYQPRFSGDALPETHIGMALSLADKLDTIMGIFAINQKPTGNKDPFALRRAAIGIIRMLMDSKQTLELSVLLTQAAKGFPSKLTAETAISSALDFILERLRQHFTQEGVRPDIIKAVFALELTDPRDIKARIQAVTTFTALPDAVELIGGHKRVVNILAKTKTTELKVNPSLFEEAAEKTLFTKLEALTPVIDKALKAHDYEAALKNLARLNNVINTFFDKVMVNCDSPKVRHNRLALLASIKTQFHEVANLSLLQG